MSTSDKKELRDYIFAEWQRNVPVEVVTVSKAIADYFGGETLGVLFYGSCLRTGELEDKILDFYVIVENYKTAYQSRWFAIANKILPPNVFYHEMEIDGVIVRSKYAVLSIQDFKNRTNTGCLNVSVWARFCQPCMLLHARSETDEKIIGQHVAEAVMTMVRNILVLKSGLTTSRQVWVAAFEETYAAELRAEREGKGLEIYLLDQERYDTLFPVVCATLEKGTQSRVVSRFVWFARRLNGKITSFLRLIKASITFDGGIDYLAWKIRRHSGVTVEISGWMRRYPMIAGITLFWQLRNKGAFK